MRRLFVGVLSAALLTGNLSSIFVGNAQADFSRPVDVISVTWPHALPLTTSIASARKAVQSYAVPYWRSHAGIEFTKGMDSSSPVVMSNETPCNGDATVNYMNAAANKFYASQGLNSSNRYLIILTPTISKHCVWEAKSIVGDYRISFGISILQNNSNSLVITHELGHALGLGHTNLMHCPDAGDSVWSSCENLEYAGGIDLMSNIDTPAPLNIYHKWRLGKIDSSDIQSVSESATFTINEIGSASGSRGLFIHDGPAIYWVEYRKAANGFNAGLAVYRTDTPNAATGTTSPNPEYTGHYIGDTSGDVWLLNLDNYEYSAKPTGSPTSWNFTTYSGNVSLSASDVAGQAQISVEIKSGTTLLPMPQTPPDLSKYTFFTSDFGVLYEVEPVDNANSLVDPTLQICNGNFPSEAHRIYRSQDMASPIYQSKYTFISSEAVQYDSPYWAAQALKEIDAAVAKCSPKSTKIQKVTYAPPASVSSRSLISTSIVDKVQQNLLATFQVKGDKMVGTYILSKYVYSKTEIAKWLTLAKKVGSRL